MSAAVCGATYGVESEVSISFNMNQNQQDDRDSGNLDMAAVSEWRVASKIRWTLMGDGKVP